MAHVAPREAVRNAVQLFLRPVNFVNEAEVETL